MAGIIYNVPPSLEGFLKSEAYVSLVCGPVGSGKSSASMLKIAYHASRMKPGKDGIRKSRAVVVRNTKQMLTDSTLPTFWTWFPDSVAGIHTKTDNKFVLKFDDVECEILFRGLDDSNDVRRLLSLEVSFGILDEYREIHQDIFEALQGRIGRYPSKANGGCVTDDNKANYHIWGASNPPDMDTFWERYMSEPPTNAAIFKQPGALSPEADWLDNLVPDYYTSLAEGKSQDYIDVYINNLFGKSLAGQPVFRAFNLDFHVAKSPLKPVRSNQATDIYSTPYPLLIGADFGLTPAAVICQIDPRGRLLIFDTLTSEGMGILRFIREKLKPLLNTKYAGIPQLVIGDPAGVQRAQTDERSVFDIFKAEGFRVTSAKTNALPARLAAVDNWLSRQVDGGAALLLDPGAKALINALRGGYRYRLNTKGEVDEKPEKNHHSHCSDALQYACLHADPGSFGGGLFRTNATRKDVKQVSYMY